MLFRVELQLGRFWCDRFKLLLTFTATATLVDPHRNFNHNFHLGGRLCALFSNSNQSSGSCQVSHLQLGQYLAGFPLRPLLSFPPFLYLFTSWDKLATSLVSRVFIAVNSVMDKVRVELSLTNPYNLAFHVVAAVARLSKQHTGHA